MVRNQMNLRPERVIAIFSAWFALGMSFVAHSQEQRPNRDAQRQFSNDLQKQLRNGRRLAIVIGIDSYAVDPLKCCVKDAKLLAATLRDRCGYDPDGILEMTDQQENPSLRPTLANLRNQIRKFLSNAAPKDTVLVSFSGHGGLRSERNGLKERRIGFVCPLDFDGARGQSTSLPIDELRALLQNCPAAQKLLVLDSCHSGGAGVEAGYTIHENVDQSLQKAQGLITFAACRREEVSSEDREVGHGIFTLSLVQGLEGLADFDQNKIVDSDEIYRHVLSEVPANVSALFPGRNQTPIRVIGQDVVGVFALAPVLPKPKATAALTRMKPGEILKNSIGMPLVLLPRSSYIKGSPKSEYKRREDEEFRSVILQKRIAMGVHEVTQAEYQAVMEHNPSHHSPDGSGANVLGNLKTGRFPVEQVSWNDAVQFCQKLSAMPAEAAASRVYRLPTESEWEYACRAGSMEAFSTGQVIDGSQANIRSEEPYWYATKSRSLGRTQTVERFPPNAFGLCDMHGNVAEWCQDYYDQQPSGLLFYSAGLSMVDDTPAIILEQLHEYLNAPVTEQFSVQAKMMMWEKARDPQGPRSGTQRVIRGGSFLTDVAQCRSAARKSQAPDYTHKALGFRVVCELSNVSR
jgi:formylglycine-generating enzyme required for sulfatase activity